MKFEEAKSVGMMVNVTRNKMNGIKAEIEQLQISRAMTKMDRAQNGGGDGDGSEDVVDGQEKALREDIEKEKELYRKHYVSLKGIKVEIDDMKGMLKKNRKRIQMDFEIWWQQHEESKKRNKHKTKVITGDQVADENIAEFYKMRDDILESIQ